MKFSTILLAASLTANVALAAVLLRWSPDSSPSAEASVANNVAIARTAPAQGGASATRPTAASTWERLRADDLSALVARLRAAGFPPDMLAAAVRELVDEQFASRRLKIAATGGKPYWQARTDSVADPKAKEALAALEREQRDLMKQLLGPSDPAANEDSRATTRHFFGRDLAPEKLARVQAIQDGASDSISQIAARTQASGTWLPDDWAKMQQIQASTHAELTNVLTPDELLDFDLRNSNTSYQLRHDLAALNPTEAEYRTLFPLYQALDAQFPPKMGSTTPEEMAPREAAVQQMNEQIKALLGPERYADFQDAKNYDYQQTAKITERLDLPATATKQVYAVQKDIEQRANAARNDRALSAADRTAQLAALATEADTKIASALGAPGLDAYHQYAGQWLQRLQPAPRANTKSP